MILIVVIMTDVLFIRYKGLLNIFHLSWIVLFSKNLMNMHLPSAISGGAYCTNCGK